MTVNDIVARARVSRREFYRHFSDIQQCFLSAALTGGYLLFNQMSEGMEKVNSNEALRGLIRGYLELCVSEPEFTKCLTTELIAAGEEALTLVVAAHKQVASLIGEAANREATTRGILWSGAEETICLAAVGAVSELTLNRINAGTLSTVVDLEETAVLVVRRIVGL